MLFTLETIILSFLPFFFPGVLPQGVGAIHWGPFVCSHVWLGRMYEVSRNVFTCYYIRCYSRLCKGNVAVMKAANILAELWDLTSPLPLKVGRSHVMCFGHWNMSKVLEALRTGTWSTTFYPIVLVIMKASIEIETLSFWVVNRLW